MSFIGKELELAMDVVVAKAALEGLREYQHYWGAWNQDAHDRLRAHLDKYFDYFMEASGHRS